MAEKPDSVSEWSWRGTSAGRTSVSPVAAVSFSPSTSAVRLPVSTVQIWSASMAWYGPEVAAAMSTRHRAASVPPWVGEAYVVMTAFGVVVTRASALRMTGIR